MPRENAQTKRCTTCSLILSFDSFHKDKRSSDGLQSSCSSCRALRKRQYKSRTGRTIAAAERLRREGYEHLLIDTDIYPGVLEALHLLYAKCGRCGSTKNLTVDHVRPIEKRGTHRIDNIGFLCPGCNRWKRDRIMKDYRTILWLDVILYQPTAK